MLMRVERGEIRRRRILGEYSSRLTDEDRLSDNWRNVIYMLDSFTGVSVNKKGDIIVVTQKRRRELYHHGYLIVWKLVSNNWQFNKYKICNDSRCVDIMSNGQYVVGGNGYIYINIMNVVK